MRGHCIFLSRGYALPWLGKLHTCFKNNLAQRLLIILQKTRTVPFFNEPKYRAFCDALDYKNYALRSYPDATLLVSSLLKDNERIFQQGGVRPLFLCLLMEESPYCLMTVPSRSRISPHPPLSGLARNGALAASFSSISIPQPGFSLTHR